MPYNQENMYKLPLEHRYFDINELWPVGNRWVVQKLYPLPVTANQVTLLSLVLGVMSARFYLVEGYPGLVGGAVFLYGKLYLDNVDGNLARVRSEVSRLGRFFDSVTDFLVTFLVYTAVTVRLVQETGDQAWWLLGLAAGLSGLIHCSYFVYFLVSCASRVGSYKMNRSDETVSQEDQTAYKQKKPLVFFMQQFHSAVYGWQDRLVAGLDACIQKLAGVPDSPQAKTAWYTDKRFLAWTGPLCLCTNNMAIIVFSLADQLGLGLILIASLGNLYLAALSGWKILRFKSHLRKETDSVPRET